MNACSKNVRWILPAAVLLLLLLVGCATTRMQDFYFMDLRSYKIPVMLNKDTENQAGRGFRALVSQESTTTGRSYYDRTYYGYTYLVVESTTESKETTQPLDSQLLRMLLPEDVFIRIKEIQFFAHNRFGFPQSEDKFLMSVDALFIGE